VSKYNPVQVNRKKEKWRGKGERKMTQRKMKSAKSKEAP
jgi:hypothetical protein